MRPWLAVLLLVTLACGSVSAPVATPAPAEPPIPASPAEEAERQRLNVWRITSPSGAISHMLGTYHIGVSIEDVLPRTTLIDEARLVLLELDMGATPREEILAATMLPPDQDLEQIVGAELWLLLQARLPQLGEVLHRFSPWLVVSMMMALDAMENRSNADANTTDGEQPTTPTLVSLDQQIQARAVARQVPTGALETFEQQWSVFDSMPRESVVDCLATMLTDPEGAREDAARRRQEIVDGDLDPIEAEIMAEVAAAPVVFDALLFQRNELWMDRLITEFDQGDVFVAVGVGHMFGERGLVALLEARGYGCERLLAPEPPVAVPTHAPAGEPGHAPANLEPGPSLEETVCQQSFEGLIAFFDTVAAEHPDASPPDRETFLLGCETLPEEVQACINPDFGMEHPECVEVLQTPQAIEFRDSLQLRN